MIPQNDMCAVVNYGSSASYCDLPAPEQIATGVIPLDSLPAAWWNAMWNATNGAVNQARCELGVLINEINSVLQQAGICPNPTCTDQLYQSINKLRQILGNATTAGAVKSSSNPSEVAIDANGIMTINCLGNAASLTTAARTVVGAVNELKSTYDCCFTDTATALSGKAPTSHASSATTYGVGTATEYGHLKISDTYATLVGDAAAGVAASQKAVNDLYSLIPQGGSVQWCDNPQLTSYPLVGCVGPATIGAAARASVFICTSCSAYSYLSAAGLVARGPYGLCMCGGTIRACGGSYSNDTETSYEAFAYGCSGNYPFGWVYSRQTLIGTRSSSSAAASTGYQQYSGGASLLVGRSGGCNVTCNCVTCCSGTHNRTITVMLDTCQFVCTNACCPTCYPDNANYYHPYDFYINPLSITTSISHTCYNGCCGICNTTIDACIYFCNRTPFDIRVSSVLGEGQCSSGSGGTCVRQYRCTDSGFYISPGNHVYVGHICSYSYPISHSITQRWFAYVCGIQTDPTKNYLGIICSEPALNIRGNRCTGMNEIRYCNPPEYVFGIAAAGGLFYRS